MAQTVFLRHRMSQHGLLLFFYLGVVGPDVNSGPLPRAPRELQILEATFYMRPVQVKCIFLLVIRFG